MLKSALLAKINKEKTKFTPIKKTITKEKTKTKSKVRKHHLTPTLKPDFDAEIHDLGAQFRIDPLTVNQAVTGLIKFTTENPKLKNQLFDDDHFPIFLQINTIKIPQGYPKILRIPLKHSLLTPYSEICLIVPDVKGIPNKNHDEHLEHYEKLLRQKGVDNIKKIMTFHEFRTEYETFELRSRLVELYDTFLVDGRISGKTVRKCGKVFYKKRKVPAPVKLRATKLKEHIEQTLMKTPLYLHTKGDSFVVEIGHSKMRVQDVAENVFYVVRSLEKDFPGGFGNVRGLNVFAHRGLRIPIYMTFKNQNSVDNLKNVKVEEPVDTVTGELTTRLNAGVRVKANGEVELYKLKKSKTKK